MWCTRRWRSRGVGLAVAISSRGTPGGNRPRSPRSASGPASASATAVFPTPVGPTRIGVLASAKAALQFFARQLDDGGPAMHIVRRQLTGKQARQQLTPRSIVEWLAGLHRGMTGIGRHESLEPIGPAAETDRARDRRPAPGNRWRRQIAGADWAPHGSPPSVPRTVRPRSRSGGAPHRAWPPRRALRR